MFVILIMKKKNNVVLIRYLRTILDRILDEYEADIAQLGERKTEDLKVPGSIPGVGKFFVYLQCPHALIHFARNLFMLFFWM